MKTLSNCRVNIYSQTHSHHPSHTHFRDKSDANQLLGALMSQCHLLAWVWSQDCNICLKAHKIVLVDPAEALTLKEKGAQSQKLHLKRVTCRGHPFCLKKKGLLTNSSSSLFGGGGGEVFVCVVIACFVFNTTHKHTLPVPCSAFYNNILLKGIVIVWPHSGPWKSECWREGFWKTERDYLSSEW